jgi:hypothetical protein
MMFNKTVVYVDNHTKYITGLWATKLHNFNIITSDV